MRTFSTMKMKKGYVSFGVKALILAALLSSLFTFFTARFRIGIDDQKVPCLGHHVYFIDLKRVEAKPVKGEAYSFVIRLRPLAGKDKRSQEFTWAKRLAAVEGDTIEITKDGNFLVNGTVVRDSLPLAAKLGKEPEYFSRRQVLKKGELYFLGDTETSYDSRYWGPVKVTQLRGKVIGGVF